MGRYASQAGLDAGYASVTGRSRAGQPIAGMAGPRPIYDDGGGIPSYPLYGPWGYWYPWYYTGFGWGVGLIGYNPWYYPATCWNWGFYGMWYSPSCYYWDPMWGVPMYAGGGGGEREPGDTRRLGSLRIKASPNFARVYIDNGLVGEVMEFNGLSDHLELERGTYRLELRADGYETLAMDVTIEGGKSQTVRLSMKKKK